MTLISQKLNNFTRAPDYIAYLAYILSTMPQEDDRIRTIAGYLLKNNARLILRAAQDVMEFVKAAVLTAFNDASVMVRGAAAQDIVAFLGILEPKNWPECLQQLVHMLDAPSADQQEVRATISVLLPFFVIFSLFRRVKGLTRGSILTSTAYEDIAYPGECGPCSFVLTVIGAAAWWRYMCLLLRLSPSFPYQGQWANYSVSVRPIHCSWNKC